MEEEYKHPQVYIEKYDIFVDEKLACLIEKLWKNRIYTIMSCQENKPGVCWLHLDNISAGIFLNKVHDLIMYDYEWAENVMEMKDNQIRFGTYPYNESEIWETNTDIKNGPPDYTFYISIRFPNKLIPEMEKLF